MINYRFGFKMIFSNTELMIGLTPNESPTFELIFKYETPRIRTEWFRFVPFESKKSWTYRIKIDVINTPIYFLGCHQNTIIV